VTERTAIARCLKDRDPRGFEFLVARYRREAYYHALGFLGNDADAADACQECFAKAFVAMSKLRRLDQFYPWFYRILRNHCLNMLGRRRTRERHAQQEAAGGPANVEYHDPAVLAAAGDDQREVWRALAALQPTFREILVLKYVDGRCYDDIATILSIPRGTVMSRLYHARRAFRDRYLERSQPGR
jgi:RNA polymerase sigma-70 factor (ECF subfamily)